MQNEWKTILGKRSADEKILKTEDKKQIFLELKRCNGFDVVSHYSGGWINLRII